MRPDAFPVTSGERCMCSSENVKGAAFDPLDCDCTNTSKPNEFPYARMKPLWNSTNYSMRPADMSYSNGNYWEPRVRDNIVAPADSLRTDAYPVQAPASRVTMVPSTARRDRIGARFARYIDQVEKRSKQCDTVSPECTVDCRAGDKVRLKAGNVAVRATVTATSLPNGVTIEFVPNQQRAKEEEEAKEAEEAAELIHQHEEAGPAPGPAPAPAPEPVVFCPMSSVCSAFEVCYKPGQMCVTQSVEQYTDFAGEIKHRWTCPDGFQICTKVEQMVVASYLTKKGKACRAAAPLDGPAPAPA